jgi:hypothetical protein
VGSFAWVFCHECTNCFWGFALRLGFATDAQILLFVALVALCLGFFVTNARIFMFYTVMVFLLYFFPLMVKSNKKDQACTAFP